jgi:hypothetical protein
MIHKQIPARHVIQTSNFLDNSLFTTGALIKFKESNSNLGKAILYRPGQAPKSSRRLRLPDFQTIGT